MADRPRVVVTGTSRRLSPSWWCIRLCIWLAGGIAIRVSTRSPEVHGRVDAVVISGGDDIDPALYSEEDYPVGRIDPARDALELRWLKRARVRGWPVLGICRGAQLLNVALGGDLLPDIRFLRQHTRNRPSLVPNKHVLLASGSNLRRIVATSVLWVNSLHYQAVNRPGKGVRIVGWDRDRIVQAIEASDDRPFLGVQWHPEYLFFMRRQLALFRWLVCQARV